MECDRVKNLYKESCKNLVKDIYIVSLNPKDENKRLDHCLKSINLYEKFCMSHEKKVDNVK
jgi:hypothetical protein